MFLKIQRIINLFLYINVYFYFMKDLKYFFLFEANSKRPSGLGKIKDKSTEEEVEFIAGDVYDLSGDNRYKDKFKYYRGEGNGYITDKDGNYYDVNTSSWSSDTGRIAGGTMNYSVVIKNVKGQDLSFYGYSAIFSQPSHADIVLDIENGMYLEDFIAKHWGCIRCKDEKAIEELKDKGDAKAKTYKAEKEESKAQKKREFFERYLVLAQDISFEIENDTIKFRYWQPNTRKKEDKPEKTKYDLRKENFPTEDAYKEAYDKLEKLWADYENKYKELDNKVFDTFRPFCEKKLKEFFKVGLNELNGLTFGVKPANKTYKDETALDLKDKKLVVLTNYSKKTFGEDWKVNKEAVADITFYPTARIDKQKASDYLKDLFKKASEAYLKLNGRQKGKYIDLHWQEYYDWYGGNGYNEKTSVKGEAKKLAERDFFKDLEKHNFNTGAREISFEVEFLKDFIDEKLPVKPEENANADTEKIETTKFSGKLADQEKKMDAWHAGTRKQNVSSCSDAKLKVNYDICIKKGYDKEAELLKKEADARGLTLESLSLDDIKFTLQDYIDFK